MNKAMWITKGPKLFRDAVRDWTDIGGSADELINLGRIRPTDPIPQPGPGKRIVLFATYGTLKSGRMNKAKNRVDQIVRWAGERFEGVLIFDEAHAGKNAIPVKGKRGLMQPSETALAMSDLQRALPSARVVYMSATGATEVENLCYAERLGLWGKNSPFASPQDFAAKIGAGGIAAMELVARDMKQLGLYIARGLSFEGVAYDRLEHVLSDEQRAIYNKLCQGWQVILNNFNAALELTASGHGRDGTPKVDGRAKGNAMSAFWSAHQRFFNQIITSMQMPSVIADIKQQLAAGHACVLQLVNTNEAAQERALAELDAEMELDELDLTPRSQMCELVQGSFPVDQYEQYMDGETPRMRRALDSEGKPIINPEAVRMREALLAEIGSIRVPDGPMEMLFNAFGVDAVAEVTGRSRRVVRQIVDGIEKLVVENRSAAKCLADVAAFQGDKKRILVFSDAGGTGASYHAARTVANQRLRVHYLVQAGWSADSAVQGFGRTHRSHQVQPPIYKLVSTDLKGQKRFISTIARRLDQLGALTKGQRQAGANGLFKATDNLESAYARDALRRFFMDLNADRIPGITIEEFQQHTGLVLRRENGELREDLPPITQFLNRLLSLQIDMQNLVFDAFADRLEALVQLAIDNGTLDLGVETIWADKVEKVREQVVFTDPLSKAQTRHVELRLSYRSDPLTWEGLMAGGKATHGKKVEFFARSIHSRRVYGFVTLKDRTDELGAIVPMYRQIGPMTDVGMPQSHLRNPREWEPVTEAEARVAWDAQVAAMPEFKVETLHLITGAVLPIWDRLKGNPRVRRLQTDAGERLLGRVVEARDLPSTLKNLGIEAAGYGFELSAVLEQLLDGSHYFELANGWKLKPARVAGERRIELLGPTYIHHQSLESDGVFAERHNYQTRLYVPTGAAALTVLERIIKARPIVEAHQIA